MKIVRLSTKTQPNKKLRLFCITKLILLKYLPNDRIICGGHFVKYSVDSNQRNFILSSNTIITLVIEFQTTTHIPAKYTFNILIFFALEINNVQVLLRLHVLHTSSLANRPSLTMSRVNKNNFILNFITTCLFYFS